MANADVPMPLAVDTPETANNSHNSNNSTSSDTIRTRSKSTTIVADCHRCHRHSSSTSSATVSTAPFYSAITFASSSSSSSSKNHHRRYSIQSSTTTSSPSSTLSPSSAKSAEHNLLPQHNSHKHRRRTTSHHYSHGNSCHHFQGPTTIQCADHHLHTHHRSRAITDSIHTVPVVPSVSFFRRIIKVLVGTGSSASSSAEDQFVDSRHLGVANINRQQSKATGGPQDSESQTDESGSCEENECSCDDHNGDNAFSYQGHSNFTVMDASSPGPISNSSDRQKWSNSATSTSAYSSSTDNIDGDLSNKSRPGRAGSIGGTSIRSTRTNSSTNSSIMANRRSSMANSSTSENVYDNGGISSSSGSIRRLGGNKNRRGSTISQQQYRQHFTGIATFVPQGTNAAMTHQNQQDSIKRRLGFFKTMTANMGAAGAGSRRGSAFSTTTAVNLTGITVPDEEDDADVDGEGGEDDDMDSIDGDSFGDNYDDIDAHNDNDFNDYESENDNYNDNDSDTQMAVDEANRNIELDLHNQCRYTQQDRVRQLTLRQMRRLRRQSLLSGNSNLIHRNKTGAIFPPPLPEYAQRPTPIQLPEILHLIFQFVVDFTPQEDYSQREIYSCLLVCRQWYLIGQKTLWREIRIKHPDKLELFVDLLKRTDTVECLGIEKNSQTVTNQQNLASDANTLTVPVNTTIAVIQQRPRRLSFLLKNPSRQQVTTPMTASTAVTQYQQEEDESIMTPSAMVKRLHDRASAVKKIVLHKLKLIDDADVLPLTSWFHNLLVIEFYICEKLTDRIVISIAENCPQLQQLLMPGCAKITDAGISQIARHCPKMRHLDLRACSNVSDESLILVAQHCRELWHLNVGRVNAAGRVTGKSIVEIAKNTSLNTLGLAGCAMNDDAVIEIARYSRSGLHRCPMLTSASVRALMQLCPNLAVLEIKQCLLVTDMATLYRFSTKRVLVELCPELQKRLVDYKCELQALNASIQSNNATSAVATSANTGSVGQGSGQQHQQQGTEHDVAPTSTNGSANTTGNTSY
ncbi:Antagonist of MEN (Mitotic Exit Network) [Linnemannia zychae]|nr:Antagonist of MEN (Mitotic Exit Network) [Linnemannia zychae]